MGIEHVQRGDPPESDHMNRVVDQVNANMAPGVSGAFGSTSMGGQTVGVPPIAAGAKLKFGKLDAEMDGDDPDGTVTVSIWDWNEAETDWEDTGDNHDDVYPPFLLAAGKTLASGTRVLIAKFPDGKWYVLNAACD